jgi:hypothetical protein
MGVNRSEFDLRTKIYKRMAHHYPAFKTKYPTAEKFNEALKDPLDGKGLLDKVYKRMVHKFPDKFVAEYKDPSVFSKGLGIDAKFSQEQREQLINGAREGIRTLYKGDFDNLYANRDKINQKLVAEQEKLRKIGKSSDANAIPIVSRINNLKKAKEVVDTWTALDNVTNDEDYENLLNGKVRVNDPYANRDNWTPEMLQQFNAMKPREQDAYQPMTSTPTENKFLKQVMPNVGYKVMELQGKDPSIGRTLFPEATRRHERGQDTFDTVIGGAKDALRLLPRLIRPPMEDMMGRGDPNVSYMAEVARPDKYKTGAQEMFDESLALTGTGGKASQLLGRAGTKLMPAVASGVNKLLPFMDPTATTIGRLQGSADIGNKSKAIYNIAKEVPNIALDATFEQTRADDEIKSPWASVIGGGLGAGLAPSAIAGKNYLTGKFTKSDLAKELSMGSPMALKNDLEMAKLLMPEKDLTSAGGLQQMFELKKSVRDQIEKDAGKRRELVAGMDSDLGTEYARTLPTQIETPLERIQKFANQGDPSMKPDMSPEMKALQGIDEEYMSQVTTALPEVQDRLAKSLERTTGVKLPTVDGLVNRAIKFAEANPNSVDSDALNQIINQIRKTKGIGEKWKSLKAWEGRLTSPNRPESPFPSAPPSMDKQVSARTNIRELSTSGGGEVGASKPLFKKAEQVQKNVMNKYLQESPRGRAIQDEYNKMAKLYDLDEALPELKTSDPLTAKKYGIPVSSRKDELASRDKLDLFLSKIGRSRMNYTEKAGWLDNLIDLQDNLNKQTGGNVDFISDAILRRVEAGDFWTDWFGEGKASFGKMLQAKFGPKATLNNLFGSGKMSAELRSMAKNQVRDDDMERIRLEGRVNDEDLQGEVSETDKRWRALQKEYQEKEKTKQATRKAMQERARKKNKLNP